MLKKLAYLSKAKLPAKTRVLGQAAAKGFTLVEVLVALFLLSLVSLLAWRGLDGLGRSQTHLLRHFEANEALQNGLLQWRADLEALASTSLPPPVAQTATQPINALDYDGQLLRLVRYAPIQGADTAQSLCVVAWMKKTVPTAAGTENHWVRWQSLPTTTTAQLNAAWGLAKLWSQDASSAENKRQVAIAPLSDWRIFYFRGNAWSNALSSASALDNGSLLVNTGPTSLSSGNQPPVPDAVRLELQLAPGAVPSGFSGWLRYDWAKPALGLAP